MKFCRTILRDDEKALSIATVLNSKYPSHGYPILLKEAQKIGLNATLMRKEQHQFIAGAERVVQRNGATRHH
jgi:hypothetical protein